VGKTQNESKLALPLKRGVTLDRQYWSIPEEPNFTRGDIAIARDMGFEFTKLIINPAPHKEGAGLAESAMPYVETAANLVLGEGLPVVLCLHPEPDFKNTYLGEPEKFPEYLDFMRAFARFIAKRWRPDQAVFQLMTEPFGNTRDWNELQPLIWAAVRQELPEHTLILSGDQVATIEGLEKVVPVDDENVYYAFEFYEPFLFTLQGFFKKDWWPHLANVPYPASPEIVDAALPAILEKLPEDADEWRSDLEKEVRTYGEARWDTTRLDERVGKVKAWSDRHGGGHHLICGEFGVYTGQVPPEDRYAFIRDSRLAFEKHGAGWTYWSFNEAFTVLKPERTPWNEATPELVDPYIIDALGLSPLREF